MHIIYRGDFLNSQNNSCNNCSAGQIPYTIRSGDTLWTLAQSYGTTVDEILKLNPGIEPENLQVGQRLCIPFLEEHYPGCTTSNYYVVRGGVSFAQIAAYFGVSTDLLYRNNMGIDPDGLYEGQVLCIPVAPSPVTVHIHDGELMVHHKNGGTTSCPVTGEFSGSACVINKQLDIGVSGARILDLSNGGAISGQSSGYGGLVVADADMDCIFNLVPVGTLVTAGATRLPSKSLQAFG